MFCGNFIKLALPQQASSTTSSPLPDEAGQVRFYPTPLKMKMKLPLQRVEAPKKLPKGVLKFSYKNCEKLQFLHIFALLMPPFGGKNILVRFYAKT